MPTYIDVHILQSVPPSNLNRDDAGSPKQATFGGVRRARVSSQAWKRATRKMLAESLPLADQATRTKRISGMLADRLRERGELDQEQAQRLANAVLKPLGITAGKKEADTAYLLFFGRRQLDGIADAVAGRIAELVELDDKELADELKDLSVESHLMAGHPLDVALFGRMVADLPSINVDAATQVAHALSTHRVDIEFDYFTAVDDEKTSDEDSGAGMIGTVEFNSATLYRYATLGLEQLIDNLGGVDEHVADGAARFVDGFVRSMPTGHQNSFAHRTLPSLVVVALRDDQPVNLVSAFERPIRPGTGGTIEASAKALVEELEDVGRMANPATVILSTYQPALAGVVGEVLGTNHTLSRLLEEVRSAVDERTAATSS